MSQPDDSDDDATLLRRYRADGSEAAFAALAARHGPWVHAAARRRLGGCAHRADDVTQAVFIALATRGPLDRSEAAMAAWMFRVLRNAAANVARAEARRRRHEAAAVAQRSATAADDVWAEVAPRLDALVDALPRRDREAILLRFYRGRSHEAVGADLGIGAEGARKRIARALDKLRAAFARAGVSVPAVALGDAMAAHVAPPGPVAMPLPADAGEGVRRLARAAGQPKWPIAVAVAAVVTMAAAIVLPIASPLPAAIAATLPAAAEPATRPATSTLADVLAQLRRNESAFTHLHVVGFRSTESRRDRGETAWTATPIFAAGDAWLDAGPRGRLRIDYAHHVSPLVGGDVPYVDQATRESWDGTEGREIYVSETQGGRTTRSALARRLRRPPPSLTGATPWWQTGAGLSLGSFVPGGEPLDLDALQPPVRLSADLERSVARSEAPALAMQTLDGLETLRVRWPSADGETTGWFAVDRGFALVGWERVTHGGDGFAWRFAIEAGGLREIRPGIWYPMRGRVTQVAPHGDRRWDYAAADVVADDPRFDPAILTPAIPAGDEVQDQRGPTLRDYVLFRDGSEHEIVNGEPWPSEP